MKVTYLEHSGFFIELDSVLLLFDWWKGELPPLPDKPMVVFASHYHQDHFKPEIFKLDDGSRDIAFLLGHDIKLSEKYKDRWGVSEETASRCTRMYSGDVAAPMSGIRVEALNSTDAGVAFVVSTDEGVIYHAGDLNWWHWEGEPDPWNPNMEHNFKQFIEPLRGRRIDLAMAPLDPRLTYAEGWGLAYLMDIALVSKVLPMHQWGDYTATDRFLEAHPKWKKQIVPIRENGQKFEFVFR